MSVGQRVWDASGNLIVDTSVDNITRWIGSAAFTASTSGSVTVAELANGRMWYITELTYDPNGYNVGPVVTDNGSTTIYWDNSSSNPGRILYGTY